MNPEPAATPAPNPNSTLSQINPVNPEPAAAPAPNPNSALSRINPVNPEPAATPAPNPTSAFSQINPLNPEPAATPAPNPTSAFSRINPLNPEPAAAPAPNPTSTLSRINPVNPEPAAPPGPTRLTPTRAAALRSTTLSHTWQTKTRNSQNPDATLCNRRTMLRPAGAADAATDKTSLQRGAGGDTAAAATAPASPASQAPATLLRPARHKPASPIPPNNAPCNVARCAGRWGRSRCACWPAPRSRPWRMIAPPGGWGIGERGDHRQERRAGLPGRRAATAGVENGGAENGRADRSRWSALRSRRACQPDRRRALPGAPGWLAAAATPASELSTRVATHTHKGYANVFAGRPQPPLATGPAGRYGIAR